MQNVFGDFQTYNSRFESNLSGPVPIFLGKILELVAQVFERVDVNERFAPLKLLAYSFSGLHASTTMAIGGATMHVPPVLRTSLEAAAYAKLFNENREWAILWRERHSDEKAFKKLRSREFATALKECLGSEVASLRREYKNLYDTLIDFGGHPNVLGVESVIEYNPISNGDYYVTFSQLAGQKARAEAYVLVAQVSVFLINIMLDIWESEVPVDDIRNQLLPLLDQMLEFEHLAELND